MENANIKQIISQTARFRIIVSIAFDLHSKIKLKQIFMKLHTASTKSLMKYDGISAIPMFEPCLHQMTKRYSNVLI